MKKIFLFIIVLTTVISGCSKDETTKSDSIIGKWQPVTFSDPSQYLPCDYAGWIKFLENGKIEDFDACNNTTSSTTTYTITGSVMTIISSTFPIPIAVQIVSLTSTTLVLEISDFGGGIERTTYKKI